MLKETNKKYVTVYTEDEANIAYKIGDATYETSGWHDDFNGFTYDDCPFWGRGGFYNDGSAHAGGLWWRIYWMGRLVGLYISYVFGSKVMKYLLFKLM